MLLEPEEYKALCAAQAPGREPCEAMQSFYASLLDRARQWGLDEAQVRRPLAQVARWCPVTMRQLALCNADGAAVWMSVAGEQIVAFCRRRKHLPRKVGR